MIDAGKLGKIFHNRANFLQDWTISPELPQGGEGLWRLDNDASGSGITGDLLAHCIDTACIFHCHFDNGSLGVFESTLYARGHKALITFEINGEHASIRWDLYDLHRLEYFDHRDESIDSDGNP